MQGGAANWCKSTVETATAGGNTTTGAPNSPQHTQAYAAYYQMYQNGARPPVAPTAAAQQAYPHYPQTHVYAPPQYPGYSAGQLPGGPRAPVPAPPHRYGQGVYGAASTPASQGVYGAASTAASQGVYGGGGAGYRPPQVYGGAGVPPPPVFTAGPTGSQPPRAAPPPVEWPLTLKKYVERCFTECRAATDRTRTEEYLKQLIATVAADGRVASHNWDTHPLPSSTAYTVRYTGATAAPTAGGVVYANPNYRPPGQLSAAVQHSLQTHAPAPVSAPPLVPTSTSSSLVGDYIPLSGAGTAAGTGKAPKRNRFSAARDAAAAPAAGPSPYGPSSSVNIMDALAASSDVPSKRKNKKMLATQLKRDQFLEAAAEAEAVAAASAKSGSGRGNVLLTDDRGHQTSVSNSEMVNRARRAQRFELDRIKLEAERDEGGGAGSNKRQRSEGGHGRGGWRNASADMSTDLFAPSNVNATGVKTGMTEDEIRRLVVVGTCARVEKDYFRLTSAPDPATVRPQTVLENALAQLRTKWAAALELGEAVATSSGSAVSAADAGANAGAGAALPTRQNAALAALAKGQHPDRHSVGFGVDYTYMCSQLKAIRQDCTVQHIKSVFTVQVYEFHARVALQSGDLNEYNQCQTQLKQLYAQGLGVGSEAEFIAYRILYYVYLQYNKTSSQTVSNDVSALLASLKLSDASGLAPAIRHALAVRRALTLTNATFNYHRFFCQLYAATPNLGRHILARLVPQLRYYGLLRLMKALRPSAKVGYILTELGFGSDLEGAREGIAFLQCAGVQVTAAEDGLPSVSAKERRQLTRLLSPDNTTATAEQLQGLSINMKDSAISGDFLVSSEKLL